MVRFRFKFETLEKVRKATENVALRALSRAQRAYHDALGVKSKLLSVLQNALIARECACDQHSKAHDLAIHDDFVVGTKQRIIQCDQAILRARRGVEKALRAYLHTRRQTRMMEVLREKAFHEFKIVQSKREQRELDDLYVMRARFRSTL